MKKMIEKDDWKRWFKMSLKYLNDAWKIFEKYLYFLTFLKLISIIIIIDN
jgi:hypothetical protein